MPATGKDLNVGDITELDANIHAGVKYMRFMIDQYFKDEPMDKLNKGLFAFASYNAGPGRVRQLRKEAGKRGLNPNVWFGNVEQIASERIGRETVDLREQHLQVLRRLPARLRGERPADCCEGRAEARGRHQVDAEAARPGWTRPRALAGYRTTAARRAPPAPARPTLAGAFCVFSGYSVTRT